MTILPSRSGKCCHCERAVILCQKLSGAVSRHRPELLIKCQPSISQWSFYSPRSTCFLVGCRCDMRRKFRLCTTLLDDHRIVEVAVNYPRREGASSRMIPSFWHEVRKIANVPHLSTV